MNTEQLEQIITSYSDMLYRIALVQTGSREEAGDMVQQTFLKLMEHREEMEDSGHLKAWLIRVCVNQCKNHRNTAWKRKVHLTNEEEMYQPGARGAGENSKRCVSSEESPQEQQMIAIQEQQALWRSIQKLPEKYRIVLHLAYQEEYTNGEIAQTLRISPGNVSVRLNRAKKLLAQQLEKEGCKYGRY